MGAQQSALLQRLKALGPWSWHHPLPAPFSMNPLPVDSTRIMTPILSLISSTSAVILAVLGAYVLRQHRTGRSTINWSDLRHPVSARPQIVLLFLHLFLAQAVLVIGWLFSAIHLIRGHVESPSTMCTSQGVLLSTGAVLSQSSVASIALHSGFVVFRLKPVSVRWFLLTLATIWMLTFGFGFLGPFLIHVLSAVPFFVFIRLTCYINPLYRIETSVLVLVPLVTNLCIVMVSYPFIINRISKQFRQLRDAMAYMPATARMNVARENDTMRASQRLLIFPCITILGNLPLLVLVIISDIEPTLLMSYKWLVAVCDCCIAVVPILHTLTYFFATPLFKKSKLQRIIHSLPARAVLASPKSVHDDLQLGLTDSAPSLPPSAMHRSGSSASTTGLQTSSRVLNIEILRETIIDTTEARVSPPLYKVF